MLSDSKLYSIGRRVAQRQAEVAELNKEIAADKEKIYSELKRRGSKKIISDDGITLTLVEPTSTKYDEHAIWNELPPSLKKKVMESTISMRLISQQVQAGKIKPELVAEHTTIESLTSYARVTVKDTE